MAQEGSHEIQLRIESVNGSPINDYRIKGSHVEMRSLAPSGVPFPGSDSSWRVLDDGEIQIHHALETAVSEWLRVRYESEAGATLDKAA